MYGVQALLAAHAVDRPPSGHCPLGIYQANGSNAKSMAPTWAESSESTPMTKPPRGPRPTSSSNPGGKGLCNNSQKRPLHANERNTPHPSCPCRYASRTSAVRWSMRIFLDISGFANKDFAITRIATPMHSRNYRSELVRAASARRSPAATRDSVGFRSWVLCAIVTEFTF